MHVLIVVADFYEDIAEMLLAGAIDALVEADAAYEVIRVPGALEVPVAIAMAAHHVGEYDGFIALGCVIRGETSHYETVCEESARGLTELGVRERLAIGNGILTVESKAQAEVRANPEKKDKGRGAALACLRLAEIQQHYHQKAGA